MKNALGLMETVGLAAAIEAADAAVKSANVTLIGVELTKGDGMVVVKIEGDVGAVKAAVEAGTQAAMKVSRVFSTKVIPRPSHELDRMVFSKETKGYQAAKPEVVVQEVINEVPEEVVEVAPEETNYEAPSPDPSREGECNYCQDPACPRRKGDPRDWCIHHAQG